MKIISGGQTGADQGALTAGRLLGLETGGMAPKGWRTQAGPNPGLAAYGLVESSRSDYPTRTLYNVLDSDGTLIFGSLHSAGCRLTQRCCRKGPRPWYHVHWTPGQDAPPDEVVVQVRLWLQQYNIRVLNVAGNREESAPGIAQQTALFLCRVFHPRSYAPLP